MKSPATAYACGSCGHSSPRWFGRCPGCGSWDTAATSARTGTSRSSCPPLTVETLLRPGPGMQRMSTGIPELDRVLGGGIVKGSVVLLSGEPGVGKSTLVLQLADGLRSSGAKPLLVSGEESLEQISMRALRLGAAADDLLAATSSSLPSVLATAQTMRPDVLVIDSIQTLQDPRHDSAAGSVVQVRECAAALVRHAKESGTAVILIGHVTKEGTVAGPRTLEHLVDAVLSLEGERTGSLRILRGLKNRFGSCDEAGVFTMGAGGMVAVEDPSEMLLADRLLGVAGSTVFPAMEGVRPMLVEVQALSTKSSLAQPRRVAIGCDPRRLALLLGVLRERAAVDLGTDDVFVAAAGGVAVREPAGDLAVCLAMVSSHSGNPIDPSTIAVGEVGLAGEVRRVPAIQRRLAEAQRLGFTRAIVPRGTGEASATLEVIEVGELRQATLMACGVATI